MLSDTVYLPEQHGNASTGLEGVTHAHSGAQAHAQAHAEPHTHAHAGATF